jgi:5-formyltetrahydrofolate cyclo-ligase
VKEIIAEKQKLRKFFREKRANLSIEKKHELSKLISQNFINFLLKNNIDFANKIFGSFVATNYEADPSYIEEFLKSHNCQICYPKIIENSKVLQFIYNPQRADFVSNERFPKIFEPAHGEILIPNYLLVPLLAFDDNLQRLGMGQGFYDNTIQDLKVKNPDLNSFGIAFDSQYSKQALPTLKTDSSLDFVVTNQNIFTSK